METYHGHVKTPADAIILFEACRLGSLPRVQRRLSEKERQSIKSGSIFVWDEREAGMRRWTDGKSWSASRVSGSFLTYREMEGKRGGNNYAPSVSTRIGKTPDSTKGSDSDADGQGNGDDGPDGYRYKPDGLMKQSFSITTSTGNHLHLISYYARSHPQAHQLVTPSSDPALRHIRPPKGMYPESTVHEQQSIPAVTRSPMPVQNPAYMPAGYPMRGPIIGGPPSSGAPYAQPYPAQWQGPPATSAPNGYPPGYPQPGTGAPLPHGGHYAPAMSSMSQPPPVTSAPATDLPRPPPMHASHQRTSSGSSYQPYGSQRPSPRSGPASLAPPMSSRHASAVNSPAATPPMPQIDPALGPGPAPFNHGHSLPPVNARTPSPAPKRDWTGTPVNRAPSANGTRDASGAIPSIGNLVQGADRGNVQAARSASNSPGHARRAEGPQDIPHEKMGFGEDVRALRVLDRAFKT